MCRRFVSYIILSVFPFISPAQKQAYNWYFGKHATVNFSSGNPVSLSNSQVNTLEGVAAISDTSGNLLFYTDGITVWNKLHQVMANGTGLFGHVSATQSGVIVPQPGNDSIYYLFTVDAEAGSRGVCYSVINIRRNNNLGEVIVKNVGLLTPTTEKIAAVRHCNNEDVWVVTRSWLNNQYYAWLVTGSGVNSTPVISSSPYVLTTDVSDFSAAAGYLKFSPDGKKLAAAHGAADFTELCEFNTLTGQLINPVKINGRPSHALSASIEGLPYGVEFSADAKLLYISGLMTNLNIGHQYSLLHQLNIQSHDSSVIENSRVLLDSSHTWDPGFVRHGSLQLAVNQKIYIAEQDHASLGVINNPNVQGAGCGFQRHAVALAPGTSSTIGLPAFIQTYFDANAAAPDFSISGNCNSHTVQFSVNQSSFDSVRWDFGDVSSGTTNYSALQNPSHTFTSSGIYNVQLIVFRNTACSLSDTIVKTIWAGPLIVNLGNDTTICQGDTLVLKYKVPGASYLWSNNSTDTVLKAFQPGQYWLRITLGNCTATDTITITTRALPVFTLGLDTSICNNETLTLFPTSAPSAASLAWSNGSSSPSITINSNGLYWLELTDSYGCRFRDSIVIQYKSLPNFSLGRDTALCQTSLQLNAAVTGASSYQWSTGSLFSSINVDQSGIYWADVTKDGCTYRDSIQVTFYPYPVVSLGSDTTVCEGASLLLDAGNPGAAYQWQNNTSSQNYLVNNAGSYHVKVSLNGCTSSDTINVFYNPKPLFFLGPDLSICSGQELLLQPLLQIPGQVNFLWQDGSSASSYRVSAPGLYFLELSNTCGSRRDSVTVLKGVCKLYVPTAFTPNGDGLNDVFRASFGENITKFRLEVYNRWGQKVFESSDIKKGWDGRWLGREQGGAVFVWIIRYQEVNQNTEVLLKGTVVLIK